MRKNAPLDRDAGSFFSSGFGGTGWMCGGVTSGPIVLGLYGGSEDMQNQDAMRSTIMAAQRFMARFEEEVGAVTGRRI